MTTKPNARASAVSVLLNADTTEGDGPPVVFLHGVFMDATLWDRVVDLLPGRRLVRVDMPSHGASPDLPPSATLDDHLASVEATLTDLGIGDAVVVGHSWGGMVGLRLAHHRPDLVAGLVLSNTPLKRVKGTARLGFHAQRAMLAGGLPAAWYGRLAAASLIGQAHRDAHPQDTADLASRTRRLGRRRLRQTLRSVLLEPGDTLDLALALPAPWTAIAGQDDYVLTGGVEQELQATGRLRVTSGGHTTPLEDPAAVAAATAAMIDALA